MSTERPSPRSAPLVAGVAIAGLVGAGLAVAALRAPAGPGPEFLAADGTQFVLDGEPFYSAGGNNYWMGFAEAALQDHFFREMSERGLKVVRIWGFNDIGVPGQIQTTVDGANVANYFQYWDADAGRPAQNEGPNGLQRLDGAVAAAKKHGVKLVIPFVNNWLPFGGMDQYVRWAGGSTHGEFYTDPQIKQWYKDWVTYLLNRENTITGVAYKDEPAIGIFELANEARCDGHVYPTGECSNETITPWAEEMAAHFKSIDSKHLLGFGDEGFMCEEEEGHWTYTCTTGQDARAIANLDDIDVVGMHVYPDPSHWNTSPEWAEEWIQRHNELAEEVGKPVYIGEIGWPRTTPPARTPMYDTWLRAFEESGGDIALVWWLQLTSEAFTPPDSDGLSVYCPSPTCDLLSQRTEAWQTGTRDLPPIADHDAISARSGTSTVLDVLDNDTSAFGEIDRSSIDLDPETDGIQTSASVDGGELSVTGDTITFDAAADSPSRVVFWYAVSDTDGRVSAPARVVLTVTGS